MRVDGGVHEIARRDQVESVVVNGQQPEGGQQEHPRDRKKNQSPHIHQRRGEGQSEGEQYIELLFRGKRPAAADLMVEIIRHHKNVGP